MSDLANFLESTYLKEFNHNDLSDSEHIKNINLLIKDAILYGIKLVMIHPKNIKMVRKTLDKKSSSVLIGTVIDFPFGNKGVEIKKNEALSAILDGADELDFVINYELFKKGDYEKVSEEVIECISLCIKNSKTIKWIIEIAALSNEEIIGITTLIKNIVNSRFQDFKNSIFIKTSTGFFKRKDNGPNGATSDGVKLIRDHANGIPIKASGGISSARDVEFMLRSGASRIGTSSAKGIILGTNSVKDY